jgi:rubredoxin
MHKHKCGCGYIWEHEDSCAMASHEEFEHAHTCPKCGARVTYKYSGPGRAEVRSCQALRAGDGQASEYRFVLDSLAEAIGAEIGTSYLFRSN